MSQDQSNVPAAALRKILMFSDFVFSDLIFQISLQDELAELRWWPGRAKYHAFSSSFFLGNLKRVHFQLLATKMVSAAAIAGHDGNIWAKSAGFNCSPEEVKKILGSWDNASAMGMGGVTVNGLK